MLKTFVILVMAIVMQACSTFGEEKQKVAVFVDAYSTIYLTRFACGLSADDGTIKSSQNTPGNQYTIIGTDNSGYINGQWTVSCDTVAAGGSAPCKIISARMRPTAGASLSCSEVSNYTIK
jgi:hypothetical protein